MPDTSQVLIDLHNSKSFGLPVFEDNGTNKPTSRTAYSTVRIFDSGTEGVDLSHTDEQIITLQIKLFYPSGTTDALIRAKVNEIMEGYSFNEHITGAGYKAVVSSKSRLEGSAERGWYSIALRITFLFYLDRV